jgi:hypothetical protein
MSLAECIVLADLLRTEGNKDEGSTDCDYCVGQRDYFVLISCDTGSGLSPRSVFVEYRI